MPTKESRKYDETITVKMWTLEVHDDKEYGETKFRVIDISDAEKIIKMFEDFGESKYTYSLKKEE
jgi:hypothetical protein